jgi:hypothetical protein
MKEVIPIILKATRTITRHVSGKIVVRWGNAVVYLRALAGVRIVILGG